MSVLCEGAWCHADRASRSIGSYQTCTGPGLSGSKRCALTNGADPGKRSRTSRETADPGAGPQFFEAAVIPLVHTFIRTHDAQRNKILEKKEQEETVRSLSRRARVRRRSGRRSLSGSAALVSAPCGRPAAPGEARPALVQGRTATSNVERKTKRCPCRPQDRAQHNTDKRRDQRTKAAGTNATHHPCAPGPSLSTGMQKNHVLQRSSLREPRHQASSSSLLVGAPHALSASS